MTDRLGYLDSRQRISALDDTTSTHGVMAGIHGRYAAGNVRIDALILHNGDDDANGRSRRRSQREAGPNWPR